MKEIDLTELLPSLVLRNRGGRSRIRFPVLLMLPRHLPRFLWSDESLEELIPAFLERAVAVSYPGRPILVAACRRQEMSDIEALFEIHPPCWIELKIEVQPFSRFDGVEEALEDSGFRYEEEWATENSGSRLIAYSRGNQPAPALLFSMDNGEASRRYSFLIPIVKPVPPLQSRPPGP